MDNNQNELDKDLKHEKLKLHYKYLIAIAIILLFGGIVLVTSNQNEFVAQVSFGSTMSSIILSVIAIWMSISGERTTNDIRIKITESIERLSDTTKNVETLNKNYENTMDTQLNELKNVQEQLTKIIFSINSVGEQVSHLQEKNVIISNAPNNNIYNTAQRIALFNTIYNTWISNNVPYSEWLFCAMIHIFITRYNKNRIECNFNNIIYNLSQANVDINFWIRSIDVYWGILNTLLAATVFDDEVSVSQILDKVNSKINPTVTSP